MKRNAGFSLIELMISAAIVLMVMVYVMQAFTVQHKAYVVIDQVAEAQQNLRAISDLIEHDVRRSGYMVPIHMALCGWDETGAPDTLFTSKADAIRSIFDLEDQDDDLLPKFARVTGTTSAWTAAGSSFALALQQLWIDIAADGADFAVGEGVIVAKKNQVEDPVACGIITGIAGTTLTVDFGDTTAGPVGFNAEVVAVPANVYRLTPPAGGTPGRFRRNGLLIASDVEDFQVTYFFDGNGDLVIDAGERYASATGTARPYELTPASNRPDFSSLEEVRVSLVTVTRSDDPNTDYRIGAGQLTGNRATGLPTGDGKRRRVSTARVRPRSEG